ncbi:MCE family protein [Actinomadura kijaniata]|uniref:Phospholipid/cholesterol/gamma-HCH transport system substrate-binding protein n=1 Tax=Actinomadura namibiensis TaxID=182080 RepID=A0A7W3LN58_ACTNM|nr:MCE family protein [Actinomadura namibiensis]MBA8951174.1 phospholipid/cholesterol/gamma-HCH transport system substrate-binding protein [Actinomadura namibiensis]
MRGLRAVAAGLAALLAAGCSSVSLEEIPLPGGAKLGDHPYTVKVQFEDALNLVPQAAVRVNDVPVGRVQKVSLPRDSWNAEVTLLINGDVRLPANAVANLEQSSLLGEKYIRLAAPAANPAAERLADGATIPLARTTRNADTEEVFGALSMLLSGGGLPQIRTINQELNKALNGREDKVRQSLRNLSHLTGTLNRNRRSIVDALDGLNRLSSTVAARRGQVDTVLTDLSPGLKVLEDQRGRLVRMLRRLEELSDIAVRTIRASQDDTVANFRDLAVILRKLSDAGRDLPRSLEVLLTYPFTDEVLKGVKGDYLNGYLTVVASRGNDCVIPPVKPGNPKEDLKRLSVKALPPQGPLPVPCPSVSNPSTPTPTPTATTPTTPADPRAPVRDDRPALPLPTIDEGN